MTSVLFRMGAKDEDSRRGNGSFGAIDLPGWLTGPGRVLPATWLARAAAVQRIAGIQNPLAVRSPCGVASGPSQH